MSVLVVVLIVVAILAIGLLVPADSWSEARPEDVEALRVRLDEECRRGER